MLDDLGFLIGGAGGVVAFVLLVALLRKLVRVCPPDQILVVTGSKATVGGREYGFRILNGGWTFVIPLFQSVESLDLGIIPVAVRIEGVNSANGITVGADATACVCVDVEDESLLYAAVERLMGKSREEIQEQIQQTMIGNFRGALNKTTPLQAIGMAESEDDDARGSTASDEQPGDGERAKFRSELLTDSNADLSSFGMRVVSVSLQKIWDSSNYIANLANKTLSHKRQEVEVEEARLRARAEQAESDADRRESVAQNAANERVVAAKGELEVTRRQCDAAVEKARLEAKSAVEKASNEGERAVQEAAAELQRLKNVSDVTLEAQARLQAAEVHATGESEAVRIVREARNELLRQKTELVIESGDHGKLVLFVQQQLDQLFASYREHAANLEVDDLVVMDDQRGVNGALNRGPAALVDFLDQVESGFGIRVRDLIAVPRANEGSQEVDR